jgi:hypothetical protein
VPLDYRPLLRAALVRLDRWVSAESSGSDSSQAKYCGLMAARVAHAA